MLSIIEQTHTLITNSYKLLEKSYFGTELFRKEHKEPQSYTKFFFSAKLCGSLRNSALQLTYKEPQSYGIEYMKKYYFPLVGLKSILH